MAAPSYTGGGVGATDAGGVWSFGGSDVATGTFVILQILQDGSTAGAVDLTGSSNINNLAGSAGWTSIGVFAVGGSTQAFQHLWCGRAISGGLYLASGTNSTSQDLYRRYYEFADVNTGTTLADVIENATAGTTVNGAGTSNTIADTGVTTLDADRLACNFVGVNDDNALAAFTGMSGGTWAEAVAEYASSTGTDGAIGLQTAAMATAGTIDGGSDTMAVSDSWGVVGFALIGTTVSGGQTGAATQALTFTSTTAAKAALKGASTTALTVSETTQGKKTTWGASTQALTLSPTTSGVRKVLGAATQALTSTLVTAAKAALKGATTQGLTVGLTTLSKVTAKGAATQALTVGLTTLSKVSAKAASSQALTVGLTTLSKVSAKGASTQALTVTETTGGTRTTWGAATQAITLSSVSSGTITSGVQTLYGAATQALTTLETTSGIVSAKGSATQALTVSETTSGIVSAKASATQALTLVSTTTGTQQSFGAVSLPLTLSEVSAGTITSGAATLYGAATQALTLGLTTSAKATLKAASTQALTLGLTTAGHANMTTGVVRLSLASGLTPSINTGHSIQVRAKIDSGSGRINGALYQGSTNVSGDLESGPLTTGLAVYTLEIPEAAAATITDYSDLEIRLWGTSNTAVVFTVPRVYLLLPAGSQTGAVVKAFTLDSTTRGKTTYKGASTQALTATFITSGPGPGVTQSGASSTALTTSITTRSGKSTGVARLSLASGDIPGTNADHSIVLRARITSGTDAVIHAMLYEGATARTSILTSSALTTSLADYTLAISAAEAATITDYSNLELQVWGDAVQSAASVFEIAQVQLEIPLATEATGVATQDLTAGFTTAPKATLKGSVGVQVVYPGIDVYPSEARGTTLVFTSTTAGSKNTHGVVTASLEFTIPVAIVTQGRATKYGASSSVLTVSSTTQGRRLGYGASSVALTASATTQGKNFLRGSATQALTLALTTAGKRIGRGASAVNLATSITTQAGNVKYGASSIALTASATAQGKNFVRGSATQALTTGFTTSGKRIGRGACVVNLTTSISTTPMVGAFGDIHFGEAAFTFPFAFTTAGRRINPNAPALTPITEGSSLTLTPVTEGSSLTTTPITEGSSLTLTPVTEGSSLTTTPVTEDSSLSLTPIEEVVYDIV